MNAGFDMNCFVRLGRVDALLERCSEYVEREAKRNCDDADRVHTKLSFLETQPASTINRTDAQSRYAPAWGKLYSRKFAICFTPISMGVNGLMCTGACGSRVCPYSNRRYQKDPMENKPKY